MISSEESKEQLHISASAKVIDSLSPDFTIPYDQLFNCTFDPLKNTIQYLANRQLALEARVDVIENSRLPEMVEKTLEVEITV